MGDGRPKVLSGGVTLPLILPVSVRETEGEKEICLLQISPRQQRPVSTDRQHCVLVAGVIVIYSLF